MVEQMGVQARISKTQNSIDVELIRAPRTR
jgi:hypothetical protein